MNTLVIWGIRLVELLFAVGGIGSFVVLVLSGVEDIETLIGPDDKSHPSL